MAYIDLFAGPGRARIRGSGAIVDGSPLIAAAHPRAPFTKLAQLDSENVAALTVRTATFGERVKIIPGDCAATIDQVIREVPPFGLNFALVDPFGPKMLRWDMSEKLGQVKRMDLLIHFPTGSIKRNFEAVGFDAMVSMSEWRKDVREPHEVPNLVGHLRRSLERIGHTGKAVRSVPIKNTTEGVLYHLVFATKDPLGDKIWSSIVQTNARGQRSLF